MSTSTETTMSYTKAPPSLKACKNYKDWVKLIKVWSTVTSLDKTRQGPAVLLSLEGQSQDAALEIDSEDLNKETGLAMIIERLDQIYLKDELAEKYNALEQFEMYRRPADTTIRDFLIEFEKRHFKVKSYKLVYPQDILAFRLLKSANLDTMNEQLVKATITDLDYSSMKEKLIKIFSDDKRTPVTPNEFQFKQETLYCEKPDQLQEQSDEDEDFTDETENETYYTNRRSFQPNPYRQRSNSVATRSRDQGANWRQPNKSSEDQWRSKKIADKRSTPKKAKNPIGRDGKISRCDVCDSINHWAQECPDRANRPSDTYIVHEIVLQESQYQDPEKLKQLVADTWSNGLLDCGASKTVCGDTWLKEYISSLPNNDIKDVKFETSSSFYKFGDGEKVQATKAAIIPAYIGHKRIFISTDVILKDLPLLLSKAFMKKANIILNFTNDSMEAFDQNIPLRTTSSGHYVIPLTKTAQLISSMEDSTAVTLTCRKDLSNSEIASRLHRQFAHPSRNKLRNLVLKAGPKWNENDELLTELDKISENCEICRKYKKTPPRPIVSLPMANTFLETVAMDLKQIKGNWIIHMIDLCTRLSAAKFIRNKEPRTIINAIMEIWIQVWGSVDKILMDNGGEFANADLINLAEKFGIRIITTAAFAPWSNGTVERHNGVLGEMMEKMMADNSEHKLDKEIALAWCINAKNSLANVNGFSPYQLSIGGNPRLPSVLDDKSPALTNSSTTEVLKNNLDALHKAREAFIQSENSEKIRRALSHNIRSTGDVKYCTGDMVYFKRDSSKSWHGPAKVIGQDSQQVLIKQGSYYIRVHPCRLQLIPSNGSNAEGIIGMPIKENNATQTENSQWERDPGLSPNNKSRISQNSCESGIQNACKPSDPGKNTRKSGIQNDPCEPSDDLNGQPGDWESAPSLLPTSKNLTKSGKPRVGLGLGLENDSESYEISNPNEDDDFEQGIEDRSTQNIQVEPQPNNPQEAENEATPDNQGINTDQVNQTPANNSSDTNQFNALDKIRPGTQVNYDEGTNNITAKINSRAGKASGVHKHWWNTIRPDGSMHAVDLSRIENLKILHCETEEQTQFYNILMNNVENEVIRAKNAELLQWKQRNVYTEVPDKNQECMSVRWVIKEKVIDGKPAVKARLCARGFEEDQMFRTDSPTCSREGNRLVLSIIASHSWKVNSLDVKTAFLQGCEIDRDVFIRPPIEANAKGIWRLNKTVYGLADASRSWYLKLKEELTRLHGKPTTLDGGIFVWHNSKKELVGIMGCFVDDVLWGGESEFLEVISRLKETFSIGSEHTESFEYVGTSISQHEDFSITVDQDDYVSQLQYIPTDTIKLSDKRRRLDETEIKMLRSAVGKLNWLAVISRPEISFIVSYTSSVLKTSTVNDILEVNRIIKFVKNNRNFITIPKLDINTVKIVSFSDASYNNIGDGGSQGAHIVFLSDNQNKSTPLFWASNKIERIVKSSLGAETLALVEGADTAYYLSKLLSEIIIHRPIMKTIVRDCYTDSRSFCDNIPTNNPTSDRRLRVDMAATRQLIERDEIRVHWISKNDQLSDCLTKRQASPYKLMQTLRSAKLVFN